MQFMWLIMQIIYPHKGRRQCNLLDRFWFLPSLLVINLAQVSVPDFSFLGSLSYSDTNLIVTVSAMTHIWPHFFNCGSPFFFPPFSLGPTKSISLTRVENKSFLFCHNRYAAQNKLPMHHSLPVCISLGSGGPISKSKSTNQFCMTIQGQPLDTMGFYQLCW